MMADECRYYEENQDAIVAGHIGEFTIIEGHKVLGYYKDIEAAIEATAGHKLGEFMLTDCKPKGEDLIYVFNQELRFA